MPERRPLVSLTRRATFSAAHRLYDPGRDEEENKALFGKCASAGGHGHNYGTQPVKAWALIAPPAGWTDARTEALEQTMTKGD